MAMWTKILALAATVMVSTVALAHDGDGRRNGGRDWDRAWDRDWDRGRDRGWDRAWDRGRDHDHRRHRHWNHHRRGGPSVLFYYQSAPPVWYAPHRPYYGNPYLNYAPAIGYRGNRVIIWSVLPIFVYDRLTIRGRDYHERAYDRAMSGGVGEHIIWNDGNDRGSVRITREGTAGNRACREFQQEITVGGDRQQGYGTACQNPDGSWQLVSER